MKNTQKLKIATIISFLIIVFPGKISFLNFIYIIIGVLNYTMELFYADENYFEEVLSLLLSIFTSISIVLIFSKRLKLNIIGIIIQYIWLIYTFNIKYIKYWYYSLPTILYLILSLSLIYVLFYKKLLNNKN
jgi:hypothetical protein